MTNFELWGPWTGAALNPATRRSWLKYRWRFRFAIIAALAIVAGFLTLTWINAQPQPRHAAEKVCGAEGGFCQW